MADALASGASGRNPVGVQVPPRPQAVVDPTTPVTSGHRQSTATSRASHIDRMRWSLRRPIRSISTPRDTLSIESRLTAERCRTGSSPGSRTTSLANPRIVVVHGAIRERLRRSMAMFLERMTTGRLPMSGGSHHHSSPRAGRGVTWLLLRCGTTQGRPTRPVRPGDGRRSTAGSHHRCLRRGCERAAPLALHRTAMRLCALDSPHGPAKGALRRRSCSLANVPWHDYGIDLPHRSGSPLEVQKLRG